MMTGLSEEEKLDEMDKLRKAGETMFTLFPGLAVAYYLGKASQDMLLAGTKTFVPPATSTICKPN